MVVLCEDHVPLSQLAHNVLRTVGFLELGEGIHPPLNVLGTVQGSSLDLEHSQHI